MIAMLIGFGTGYISKIGKSRQMRWVIGAVIMIVLIKIFFLYPTEVNPYHYDYILESPTERIPLIYHLLSPQNLDKSDYWQPQQFSDYVFDSLPENSILVGDDDPATPAEPVPPRAIPVEDDPASVPTDPVPPKAIPVE